ncbi:MAG: hypothetical protein OXF45_04680 [Candidatus Dadabacteria bacterium]|nr:hypothetical protein [Candidatus Dadabacteria bacterium]
MSNSHQRKGTSSNSDVGRKFAVRVQKILEKEGFQVEPEYKIPCGLPFCEPKEHKFDFGSDSPRVIVECKSHTWTKNFNVPSAKMADWVRAMFYFHTAPSGYRKIFIVEQSVRPARARTEEETLLNYFIRTQAHLIPRDVYLWELDDSDKLTRT